MGSITMINDDTCIPEFRVTSTETDDDKPVYGMGYCSYPILRSQSHYQYYPIYRKRLSGIHSLIYMKPPSKPCFGLCFFCWVHVREGIQCQGKDQMILKLHVLLFFDRVQDVMFSHGMPCLLRDILGYSCLVLHLPKQQTKYVYHFSSRMLLFHLLVGGHSIPVWVNYV